MASVRITFAGGMLAFGLALACGIGYASAAASGTDRAGIIHSKAVVGSKKSVKPAKGSAKKETNVKAAPGPGRMQVEEPKASAPMGSARESKAWQKNHARGLTDAQKQAFRERKEKMEGMIAVIKEKRKALRDAKPEERAALARELHSLILEKDPGAETAVTAAARVSADKQAAVEAKAVDKDAEKMKEAAEIRAKQIEAYQAQLKRQEELRKQQLEKLKAILEGAPASGNPEKVKDED
ncbi:MAG: hypothetical protein JWP91_4587 [Fibrobacteres bacterium]|nr:hypothetical protein [Fibrobacterota bacterium]